MADPVLAAYADCIDYRCDNCGALPDQWCTNRITTLYAAVPCLAREKAAQASDEA